MASRKELARVLRRHPSDAEQRLWYPLRARRLAGFKFRRPVPIDLYIVDFVCLEARLVVEADGGQHAEQADADAERTVYLEARGFRALRFWNHEILADTTAVLGCIRRELIAPPHPNPSP